MTRADRALEERAVREAERTEPFAGLPGAVVCLSPQEWDAPLRTNRQHVMSRLARRQPVVFVHTADFLARRLVGVLRLPRVERAIRLAELFGGLREREPGLWLFSAWNLVPGGRRLRWASRLNGALTRARLLRALRRAGKRPSVAWAYDPFCAPVATGIGASLLVYHCVDDHAAQVAGRVRRRAMRRAEDDLVNASDLVFTSAASFSNRVRPRNGRVYTLGNVADYDHFSWAADGDAEVAPELKPLPRPRALFVGALNEMKVDLKLLEALAERRPDLALVVVGPVTAGGLAYRERLATLGLRANVHILGERPYEALPGYLAGADVGLIPYAANDYTAGVFPMKVYEYLAAGLPVVAAGLPELREAEGVTLADGPDAFVAAVARALNPAGTSAERQAVARRHTWETRLAEMDRLARDTAAAR